MQNEFPAERVYKVGTLGKGDTSFPNRPRKYRKSGIFRKEIRRTCRRIFLFLRFILVF